MLTKFHIGQLFYWGQCAVVARTCQCNAWSGVETSCNLCSRLANLYVKRCLRLYMDCEIYGSGGLDQTSL